MQTTDGLLSRESFRSLSLGRRRVLCLAAYGSGGAAFALLLSGSWWFAALVLLAVAAAAYYPLHVFSESIDFRAMHRPPFGSGRADDGIDESQVQLLYNVYRSTRWILGSAVMIPVLYPMLASWLGWWLPTTDTEWSLVILGISAFVLSVPTILWNWLEPGTHDLPYPADEDVN